jgi:histone-lysine N-methyltransferase SETD7
MQCPLQTGTNLPAVTATARRSPHPQSDLVCDIFSDIMTLAETASNSKSSNGTSVKKKRTKKMSVENELEEAGRLTFPQIWVESFCESSCGEDDDEDRHREHLLQQKKCRGSGTGLNGKVTNRFNSRSKDKVIKSLQLTSCSTDDSFEGSLSVTSTSSDGSSSSSSGVGLGLGGGSRQNSVDFSDIISSREETPPATSTVSTSTDVDLYEEDGLGKATPFRDPLATTIQDWLSEMEAHGVDVGTLQTFSIDDIDMDVEDDTWFETGLVRVFDPYYDFGLDEISRVDGKVDPKTGQPLGICTVMLKNGDEIFGIFKNGLRQGRGSIEGVNLMKHGILIVKGFYKDSVLSGRGKAILAAGSMWDTYSENIHLEGVFNDGYLEGPVRGVGELGDLVFVGQYSRGVPFGPCWVSKEGQGWLHGKVNAKGRFTGDDIAFVYPDRSTCLVGKFEGEVMRDANKGRIVGAEMNAASIMCLDIEQRRGDDDEFTFSPSNSAVIECEHRLRDPYETEIVVCRESRINGAGDGLFAKKDLPSDTLVSYYNGLKVQYEEHYAPMNFNYQIYVDWNFTDKSAFIDIPTESIDSSSYCASLAHKANHSFLPNCQFVSANHPRFGRVPSLKTIRPVARGDELLTHYKYDMALAPNWYTEAWQMFSAPNEYSDYQEDHLVEEKEKT